MQWFKRIINPKGAAFERLAQHFLECQGYRCVTQNFCAYHGEIDLIMHKARQLAFVEVRYRRSEAYGTALDSIDQAKQRRITTTAEVFLKRYPHYLAYHYRFDAVVIGPDCLRWYHNAF